MPQQHFELACDRLSHAVDATLFERLRWERNEGPMLARLVSLAHGALEKRDEFELTEEGATSDIKRFVLKVHSNRVVAISIMLDGRRAVLVAEAIERSKFRLASAEPVTADFDVVDEAWMAAAFHELFSRIQ